MCLFYRAISPTLKDPARESSRSYVIKIGPELQTTSWQMAAIEEQPAVCPPNFILMPGSQDFATPRRGDDFCIGKYPASK